MHFPALEAVCTVPGLILDNRLPLLFGRLPALRSLHASFGSQHGEWHARWQWLQTFGRTVCQTGSMDQFGVLSDRVICGPRAATLTDDWFLDYVRWLKYWTLNGGVTWLWKP